MKKYEKIVDEAQFLKLKKEAMEASRHVLNGIEALKSEGIPTDEKTIKMLTASPEALENFIRDSANNQIGKGFVPPEEKSRIYKVYSELLGRINSKVQAMRKSLAFVPIIFNGDNVEIDYKSLEKIALEKATYQVDMEGLKEYYSKVQAVEKAINDLRAYEIEKGLPDFRASGFHYTSELGMYQTCTLQNFFSSKPTFEHFRKVSMKYFLKK
jgi:hypothetical protein